MAEQALRTWRLEALLLERRGMSGGGMGQAIATAERESGAARDFLAPPPIALSLPTLQQALKKLRSVQLTADAGSLANALVGNDAVAKAARLLVWQAPGSAPEPAGDRARRLCLSAGSPSGAAALRHAIAYGADLLFKGDRVIPR